MSKSKPKSKHNRAIDSKRAAKQAKRVSRSRKPKKSAKAITKTANENYDRADVSRYALEAMLENTDIDFGIVIAFKRHGSQGAAFRISTGFGKQCPTGDREFYSVLSEETSKAIAAALHAGSGGENVIAMDKQDRPSSDPAPEDFGGEIEGGGPPAVFGDAPEASNEERTAEPREN